RAIPDISVLRSGPSGVRLDRRVAVTEPELQLVVHRADVEELRAVQAALLLWTHGSVEEEAVVPGPGRVAERLHGVAGAAVRDEPEPAADLRPHAGQVEA